MGDESVIQGQTFERPSQVPENLVMDYPIKMGAVIAENPFDRIIPAIHAR
jgi:hypothetical protein